MKLTDLISWKTIFFDEAVHEGAKVIKVLFIKGQ